MKQSMRDRMDEGEGMVRADVMKEMHPKMHQDRGMYKNQVEMPEIPPMGHLESGYGCMSFKGEADPIAYGQSAKEGCKMDDRRMAAQFKDYHWD